jgi:transcriptional regulator with XRE-family HTH domain
MLLPVAAKRVPIMGTLFLFSPPLRHFCRKKRMADLSRSQKQELAQLLYTRGDLSQKEVAAKVGVSEATMSKWAKADGGAWGSLRLLASRAVDAQLVSLGRQLDELNAAIAAREPGSRYPTSKEADILGKLAAAIKKLKNEVDAGDILNVSIKMLNWMRGFDLPKAQELSDYFDAFLKEAIGNGKAQR